MAFFKSLFGLAAAALIQSHSVNAAVLVDTGLRPAIALSATLDDIFNDSGDPEYSVVHEEASLFTVAAAGTATDIRVASAGTNFSYYIVRDDAGMLVEDDAHLVWRVDFTTPASSDEALPPDYYMFGSFLHNAELATYSGLNINLEAGDYWFVLNSASGSGIPAELIAGSNSSLKAQRTFDNNGIIQPYTYAVGPQLSLLISGRFATGAVPEPATWAFMIAGFAALGVAQRRRRRRAAVPTPVKPTIMRDHV